SRVISVENQDQLQNSFENSFATYYELEQNENLALLINDKNEQLKRLSIQLEQKVEDRQAQLETSRKKNMTAEMRSKILKKTLMLIYQASSITEIEHGITEALKKEFNISWVNIRRPSQSNLSQKKEKVQFYKVDLKSGKKDFGHLFFFKEEDTSFSKQDKKFLSQVAEAVSLSIERTFEYQKSRELKKQWEATFDAILDPICLTDEKYNIQRVNASFIKKSESSFDKAIGEKCYRILFDRDEPCKNCRRGEVFQLRNPSQKKQSEVFDVYTHNLANEHKPLYFQMYRDITQDLNLQRQVIESAKMAELGTISSSIAHELNNPIGGMLNFVQLMKMDLTGEEDFFEDLIEIEKGVIKCKNIVKNLLGFSSKSFNADIASIDLAEVISNAVKITELKTSSIGIKINFEEPQKTINIPGRFNLIAHAVRNILQNSQESLIEKKRLSKGFQGIIDIDLEENDQEILIKICDNGMGLKDDIKDKIFDPLFTTKASEANSGLGLTLALQIVEEHKGSIDVSTSKDKKLCFIIRFFKSEVQSGPSTF
ncbi:MAG: HAMP domain-containing histidine kinase, partial [Bdellovibrionales bacterium]|nr:HAMP domain-containing histidine kinase [Bdellovibrionales bacterium]NQZ18069.1 HAMP domain-containing histidine kinase [Bdellovibrionales bacterium]